MPIPTVSKWYHDAKVRDRLNIYIERTDDIVDYKVKIRQRSLYWSNQSSGTLWNIAILAFAFTVAGKLVYVHVFEL